MSVAWPIVPLSEVLETDTRYVDAPEDRVYPKLSVKLYGRGVTLDAPADGATLKMQRHQLARAGQVILSEIWGKKGAIGLVPPNGDGALCTSHFFLFNVREDRIERGWLRAMFMANYLEPQLNAEAKGTTGYAAVRPKHLLTASIPLPPLAEQRRIVARLDALAAKIEEAKGLQHETSDALEALEHGMVRGCFARCSDAIRLPIEQVCEVRGGIQKSPSRTAGANPVRYLTVAHVFRNRIKVDDPRYFEVSPSELERCRLQAGDVLIIEGNGSADQIGRAALFQGEIDPCVHQNHVIRVRPDQSRLRSAFLNAFLNSPVGQDEVQTRSRTTSGLRSLSVGRIREIEIPVPTLEQQAAIVASVAEARSRVRRSQECARDAGKRLGPLLPSILNRAFAGAL